MSPQRTLHFDIYGLALYVYIFVSQSDGILGFVVVVLFCLNASQYLLGCIVHRCSVNYCLINEAACSERFWYSLLPLWHSPAWLTGLLSEECFKPSSTAPQLKWVTIVQRRSLSLTLCWHPSLRPISFSISLSGLSGDQLL